MGCERERDSHPNHHNTMSLLESEHEKGVERRGEKAAQKRERNGHLDPVQQLGADGATDGHDVQLALSVEHVQEPHVLPDVLWLPRHGLVASLGALSSRGPRLAQQLPGVPHPEKGAKVHPSRSVPTQICEVRQASHWPAS